MAIDLQVITIIDEHGQLQHLEFNFAAIVEVKFDFIIPARSIDVAIRAFKVIISIIDLTKLTTIVGSLIRFKPFHIDQQRLIPLHLIL